MGLFLPMSKWISLLGGVVSVLTIFSVVSAYPDFWIFSQTDARLRAVESLEIRTASAVAQVTADYNEHIDAQTQSARIIAEELANTRLLVEEKYISLSIQMEITRLEDNIKEITRQITTEKNESDRLDRVINGNTAAPPSEETYRAKERVTGAIRAYEAELQQSVRELNRLMTQ